MCGYIVDSKAIFITALLFSAGMFWINKLVFFYPLNLPTVSLLVYVSAYKSCDLPFLFNVECYKKKVLPGLLNLKHLGFTDEIETTKMITNLLIQIYQASIMPHVRDEPN